MFARPIVHSFPSVTRSLRERCYRRALAGAVLAAAIIPLSAGGLFADNSLNVAYSGGTYTQNFNSLWTNSATPPANLEPGLNPVQIGPDVVGSAPIDLTGPSTDFFATIPQISTMTGWYATSYGGNSVALKYNVDDGTSTSVALTAYYDPAQQSAGNNLALGTLTGSASGYITYGVRLVNTSGGNLNAISLSYTGQLFHQDLNSQGMTFSYLVDPSGTAAIPTTGTTVISSMNVGGFATGTIATIGPVPTSPASTEALSVTNLPLATTWAPGQALWLTWTTGSGGGGQGLAIDNLSFSATNVAAASMLTWNLPGSGNWNTTDANWTGAGTVFANGGYDVSFGNIAADSTISVDPAGAQVVSSVTVNNTNTAATYTFSGGSIGGAGASLNITGGGTVKLTSANTYGLATNVNASTLIVDNDNEMGVSAAPLNLIGGTLKLAGSIDSGHRPLVISAAGGAINTNGFHASFGATNTAFPIIYGDLHITGGGNVNLGLQPSFGTTAGRLIIDAGSSVTLVGNGRSSPTNFYAGGVINGDLIFDSTSAGARFNFNSPGTPGLGVDHNGDSKFTGTGRILVMTGSGWVDLIPGDNKWQLDTNGLVLCNLSATYSAEIDVPIYLNPLADSDPVGHPFHALDVSTAAYVTADNPNPTNSFATVIGGTKIGTQGHGPDFSNLIIAGVISGHSDINVGNDYKGGGSGDVTLLAQNTYVGATMLNGGGCLYLGVTDALPATTDVIFGTVTKAGSGLVDISGHNQHIRSLSVALGTNSPQAVIVQNSGHADATLYIGGDNTPYYPYNAQLNDGGQASDGTFGTHTLALAKSGAGTFVLGEYLSAGHATTSSYSGGTTVSAGVLQIGFDAALGAQFDGSGNIIATPGFLKMDGGTLSVQNPFFIGDASGTETTASMTSSRPFAVTAHGGTIFTPTFQATLQYNSTTVHLIEPVTFTGAGGYNWASTAAHPLVLDGAPGSTFTINGGAGSVSVVPGAAITISSNATLNAGGTSDPFTDSSVGANHVDIVNNGSFNVLSGVKAVGSLSGPGATTVSPAATLLVTSNTLPPTGTGTVTLNGATLGGHGTISGNVVAGAGSNTLAPSASLAPTSAGTLSMGSLTTNANTTLDLNLVTPNTAGGSDQIAVSGALNISGGGALAFTHHGLGQPSLGYYKIMSYGSLTGTASNLTMPAIANNISYVLDLNKDPGFVDVHRGFQGDANDDGTVNIVDLGTLATHYNGTGSSWSQGDFNGDGVVNIVDLGILATYYNQSVGSFEVASGSYPALESAVSGTSSVPEPTSLLLLGAGLLAALGVRRRTRR